MTDHAPQEQSAGAPASVEDRISSLAAGLLTESQDNPNAWPREAPEGEEAPATAEASEAPPETEEQPAAPEATPTEEMEEVEYADGKKYQVPKELKRGWLREDDYTRKTQKLAEGFRAVDGEIQKITQTAQTLQQVAPLLGQLQHMDSQIQALQQQLSGPALEQLEQTDPLRIGPLAAKLQLLMSQRGQLAQHVSSEQDRIAQTLAQTQDQVMRARMQTEMPILESTIKDFNPEKHGKEVADYLRKSGLAQEALGFINYSPAALALVWKAKLYDQLQADKKTAQKKVETLPPVAKPGQRTSQAEGDVKLKELRDLNRKTGGRDPDVRRALLKQQLFGR